MRRCIALGAAAIAIAAGAGWVSADAATTGQGDQPANPRPLAAAAATPVDTAVESKFTPITACRIADTRLGGGIVAHNTTRGFQITGTSGFAAQGGTSTGCGIPSAATAVALSITATQETGSGYVTIYPNSATKPLASVLSFTRGVSISGNTNATLGSNGQIRSYVGGSGGSSHLVLDITGYYISPMRAEVSSTGTLVRGSRVSAVTHIGTGAYQVDFDRDVSGCTYSATSYYYSTMLQVQPRLNDAHGVYVAAANADGIKVDASFYLTVTC